MYKFRSVVAKTILSLKIYVERGICVFINVEYKNDETLLMEFANLYFRISDSGVFSCI